MTQPNETITLASTTVLEESLWAIVDDIGEIAADLNAPFSPYLDSERPEVIKELTALCRRRDEIGNELDRRNQIALRWQSVSTAPDWDL